VTTLIQETSFQEKGKGGGEKRLALDRAIFSGKGKSGGGFRGSGGTTPSEVSIDRTNQDWGCFSLQEDERGMRGGYVLTGEPRYIRRREIGKMGRVLNRERRSCGMHQKEREPGGKACSEGREGALSDAHKKMRKGGIC